MKGNLTHKLNRSELPAGGRGVFRGTESDTDSRGGANVRAARGGDEIAHGALTRVQVPTAGAAALADSPPAAVAGAAIGIADGSALNPT